MIEIRRNADRPSDPAPAEYFTGGVRIEQMFFANETSKMFGLNVSFEPKARTAWHSHPLGQTLIVTSGMGLIQEEGGPIQQIHPGDVIWISANQLHWHGASATTSMAHIAIQEMLDNNALDWDRQVTDEDYSGIMKAIQEA